MKSLSNLGKESCPQRLYIKSPLFPIATSKELITISTTRNPPSYNKELVERILGNSMEPLQFPRFYQKTNLSYSSLCKNIKLTSLPSNSLLKPMAPNSTKPQAIFSRKQITFRVTTGRTIHRIAKNKQNINNKHSPFKQQEIAKEKIRTFRKLQTALDRRPESRYSKESLFTILENGRECKDWDIPIVRMNLMDNIEEQAILPSSWS